MAFQVSPGINVTEIDLTTVVPAVSTSVAAIAGVFNWGPVETPVLISTENQLVSNFGKPTDQNFETFFSAANFLAYSSSLYVSRAAENAFNAVASVSNTGSTDVLIKNSTAFLNFTTADADLRYVAKYPGALGNSLKVSEVKSTNEFAKSVNLMSSTLGGVDTSVKIPTAGQTYVSTTIGSNAVVVRLGKSDNAPSYSFNASTAVNATTDAITLGAGHDLQVNDRVVYIVDGGNTAIGGLTNGTSYYVKTRDATTVVLSTSIAGPTIQLTPGSNETGHALSKVGTSGLSLIDASAYLNALISSLTVGSKVKVGDATDGYQYLTIKTIGDVVQDVNGAQFTITTNELFKLSSVASTKVLDVFWEYYNLVDDAPASTLYAQNNPVSGDTVLDEITVIVTDYDGKFTGTPGTVLEVFSSLSRATDAKSPDGASIFYKDVINNTSKYVWAVSTASDVQLDTLSSATNTLASKPTSLLFRSGANGLQEGGALGSVGITVGKLAAAYDVFKYSESTNLDISFIIGGKPVGLFGQAQLGKYILDNIVESRMDCVLFVSPPKSLNVSTQLADTLSFRSQFGSSSYGVMDSGYKLQYDKYNDKNRYVPLNGDIAGLTARTDDIRDPWYSPAGFNRGSIKNVIKLWWNPSKAERDELYKKSVNPVVTFQGQGHVLYGDKTLLSTPSAFDRINVRRLFIVLEKAIATAAQSSLFEFNDQFTRTQFKNLVEPFLREVQGRRGIFDFRVVCDDTNNTAEVIDSNGFVGDIYIKPARSINFIQLNFVAARTGVEFTELVGQF